MNRIPRVYATAAAALAVLLLFSMPVIANEIEGTLSSIAPDDHVFTMIDNDGTEQTLRLRVDGSVFVNDEEQSLADLQAGDAVTVTYDLEDEEMVATIIRCKRN
jgi:hypothetical protein